MAKRGDPDVSRLLVRFLRSYARMTQAGLARAARVDQSDVSEWELGNKVPPEEALRRMAEAADLPWPAAVHLRRLFAAVLAAAARRRPSPAGGSGERLDAALLEAAVLAVAPYLEEPEERRRPSPEEERREAGEVCAALLELPAARRRSLLELAPRASRNPALAERLREASAGRAAGDPEEVRELSDLARFVAGRSAGE